MLLTMALSPDREEYAHPYSAREYHQLEARLREAGGLSPNDLMGMDITRLMSVLGVTEEQALRLYTLLSRGVAMNYAIENQLMKGIGVITQYDAEYPRRLSRTLGEAAPPLIYAAGDRSLLGRPAVAVLGLSGIRTTPALREGIDHLVQVAAGRGYAVMTGGELGVSRVAAEACQRAGGTLIDVVAGSMAEHLEHEPVAAMLAEGRAAVFSIEHPEALFTSVHALSRNRVIFALARAAFICNTDLRRGEMDALQNHICPWIYAWTGADSNRTLLGRGAIPVKDLAAFDLDAAAPRWEGSESEQLSMFDGL